ncbi:hypothetical protein ACMATS_05925 [Streptoverticillium reticulum]|uniref:hypothetical protein n=1 Tax=Streptoverticillium reticulum TaxID=1433415 RepID=UPI0039BF936D
MGANWGVCFLGADVGQAADAAALVGLAPAGPRPAGVVPTWSAMVCETAPLGAPYAQLAAWLAHRARQLTTVGWSVMLAFDRTGVGRAVGELLRDGLRDDACEIVGVTAHAGKRMTGTWPDPNVPKTALAHALITDLEQHALAIPQALPAAHRLQDELTTYTAKTTEAGHVRYEHGAASAHDDVVAALQLACWAGRHWYTVAHQIYRGGQVLA